MQLLWSKKGNSCLLHPLALTKQTQFCRELCSHVLTRPKLYCFFSLPNISQTQYQKQLFSLFQLGQGSGLKVVRGLPETSSWHSTQVLVSCNQIKCRQRMRFSVSCVKIPELIMMKKKKYSGLILVLIQKLLILRLLHCPLRGRHSHSSHCSAWNSLIKCWTRLNKITHRSKCLPTHHYQFSFSFSSLAWYTTITLWKSHLHSERGLSKRYFIKLRAKYHCPGRKSF